MSRRTEAGFTLLEALIATAMLAGLFAAISSGLSVSTRGARTAVERVELLFEAENIAARLVVGQDVDAVFADYADWTVERAPYDSGSAARRPGEPYLVKLDIRNDEASFEFELVVERREPRR